MPTPTPPTSRGYMNRIKPMTRQEAAAAYTNDNIVSTVKTAIVDYIQGFFAEANANSETSLLAQFGRGSTRYIVDKDFDPSSDKTKTKLPIHKFFEEIKSDLPCIIVSTTGCTFKSSGLGINDGTARLSNGTITSVHHVMRDIPIAVLVATTSQQDTEKLAQVLQMMFGEMIGSVTGYVLHGHNEYDRWALHLPKIPEFAGFERNPIGDSQTSLVWSTIIGLNTLFEDNIYITHEDNRYTVGNIEADEPTLDFPSLIRVGRKSIGRVISIRDTQSLMMSDPTIATLSKGAIPSEYYILAKRPGTLKLWIVDGVDNNTEGSKNFLRPNIIVEKSITLSY